MVVAVPQSKTSVPLERLKRFTAREYDSLTQSGIFTSEDRFELLDRLLVNKMPTNEANATSLDVLEGILIALLITPWTFRTQRPILVSGDSRPEPDLVIVKGPKSRFYKHHPKSDEIALIVEVAETSLDIDRGIKQEIYAGDHIPEYWIVNLVDRVVEVYTGPKGGKSPSYRHMIPYGPGSVVPLRIDAKELGLVAVNELLPEIESP